MPRHHTTNCSGSKDGVGGVDGLDFTNSVSVSPDGAHLYSGGSLDDAVAVFSRNSSTGALTFVEFHKDGAGGVDGLDDIRAVAVSPDGKHLYTAGGADNAVALFTRNTTTGALTFVEIYKDGVGGVDGLLGTISVYVSPDGNHVYAAGVNDHAVAVFSRNSTTGALTFVEFHVDGSAGVDGILGARFVTVSPDGKHTYVAGTLDNAVAVFSRSTTTGALTYVTTSKDEVAGVDGLGGIFSVTVSPDGKHAYAAGGSDDAVAAFSRNSTTGALTFVTTSKDGVGGVDGLNFVVAVTVSPDGKHVYATGNTDDAVAVFSRNSTTGALTFVEVHKDTDVGIDGLNGAFPVSVSPDGDHVYVGGDVDDAVAVFSRNSTTGALTWVEVHKDDVAGVDGLNGPTSLTVSPDGRHIYAGGQFEDAIAVFSVTGALATTSVVPASLAAGATGNVVVTFTTANAVSAGKVQVTFPAGFDVSGAGVNASGTNISGTLALDGVAGQIVTITGATISAGQAGAAFTLTGITNPTAAGGTGTFGIETQTIGGFPIDEDSSVAQVTITHAAAFEIVVTSQPSASTVAGVPFALQPVATVKDQFGNTVTTGPDSTGVMTATLTTGTGTLTDVGANNQKIINAGVADYFNQGLKIDLVGTDKVLTFTPSGNGTPGTSIPFTITHAAASQLVVTSQPSASTVAGVPFALQPVVTVRDQFGNTVTTGPDSSQTIIATLTTGTGTLTDVGAGNQKLANAGVADYFIQGLKIDLAGTDKVLTFSGDGNGTADTSAAFTITHAAASQLVVTSQPSASSAVGFPFAVQPVVTVQDQFGNTVTNSVLVVTASLTTGSGTLTGTVTETAVAGVANFVGNGMKIDQLGTDKVLTFSASGVTSATSNPAFSIATGASVPGVGTWGLIATALLMAGAAFVVLRRRSIRQA